jgi:hypothetical protein
VSPEQFMATLTDMVYVEHFDAGTWKEPVDVRDISSAVRIALVELTMTLEDTSAEV